MIYYIVQLPVESGVFYEVEAETIEDVKQWGKDNLNNSYSHVIRKELKGRTLGQVFNYTRYYYNGVQITTHNSKEYIYNNVKIFATKEESLSHYQDCKKQAEKMLKEKAEKLNSLLNDFKIKENCKVYADATVSDDTNLNVFLTLEVIVHGIPFTDEIDYY